MEQGLPGATKAEKVYQIFKNQISEDSAGRKAAERDYKDATKYGYTVWSVVYLLNLCGPFLSSVCCVPITIPYSLQMEAVH